MKQLTGSLFEHDGSPCLMSGYTQALTIGAKTEAPAPKQVHTDPLKLMINKLKNMESVDDLP